MEEDMLGDFDWVELEGVWEVVGWFGWVIVYPLEFRLKMGLRCLSRGLMVEVGQGYVL